VLAISCALKSVTLNFAPFANRANNFLSSWAIF